MRRLMFIAVVMSMTFTACNNDEFEIPSLKSEEKEISYVVTPEEAISRLEKFLAVKGTRVSLKDVAIKMLKQSDFIPTTRSADADNPAIYLIDIPDGGCAVMGADMRLEPVYAIMDETKLSPEDLTATTRTESANEEDIQTFVTGLINDAVEADIMGLGPFPKDTLPFKPIPSKLDSLWTETTVDLQVVPLLDTKWDQHEPFNNNYPMSPDGRKKAGCGIIASAQIMYYHKQPSFLGGVMFDWDLLRFYEHGYHNQPLSATLEVANYVRTLADASNIEIGDELPTASVEINTSTPQPNIVTLFNAAGYSNVNFVSYTLNSIQNMLDDNHPVLISAKKTDDYSEYGNHMWVIDGCNVYKVEYWTRVYTYVNDFTWSYNDYVDTHHYNLLHCNYGFRGSCDGYYSSGIFNTNVELPSGYIDTTVGDIEGTAQGDFSRDMSIMMYHK